MPPQYPTYTANQILRPTGIPDFNTGTGIARGLAQLGAATEDAAGVALADEQRAAVARGRERGPALVYNDDQGNPVVSKDLPGLDSNLEGRTAREVARQTAMVQSRNAADAQAQILAQQHKDDPQGFDDAWLEYKQRQMAGAPETWLAEIRNTNDMIGQRYHAGILVGMGQRQDALDKQGWGAAYTQAKNEQIGLQEQGLGGDPRMTEAVARVDSLNRLGVAKGYMDQQTADIDRENQTVLGKAAGVTGIVVGAVKQRMAGGASSQDAVRYGFELRDKLVNDPQFASLTPREREVMRDRIDERVHELLSVNKEGVADLDREVSLIEDGMLQHGMQTPTVRLGEIAQKYRASGEPDKAREVMALIQYGDVVQSAVKRPISDQVQRLADLDAGVATPESVKLRSVLHAALSLSESAASDEVAHLKDNAVAIVQGEKFGMTGDADGQDPTAALAQTSARLRELGQKEAADDLDTRVQAANEAVKAGQQSVGAFAQTVGEWQKQFPTPEKVMAIQLGRRGLEARIKALNDDALTSIANLHPDAVGPLKPLDFSAVGTPRSGEFSEALKERKRQAGIASQLEDGYPVGVFTAPELDTVKRFVDAGNADQQAAFAATLHDGLGDDGVRQLAAILFKSGVKQRVFAYAAEMAPRNQDVARGIIAGQEILSGSSGEKSATMPETPDLARKLRETIYPVFDPNGSLDPQEMNMHSDISVITDRYQATADAVTAHLAYLRRGKTDTSFGKDIDAAITAVTGGIIKGPGGRAIFAPQVNGRGIPGSEFSRVWQSTTMDDFGQIAPTDTGERLNINQLHNNTWLATVGPNTYEVYIGNYKLYRDDAHRVPVQIDISGPMARASASASSSPFVLQQPAAPDWRQFDAFMRRNSGLAQPMLDEFAKKFPSLSGGPLIGPGGNR